MKKIISLLAFLVPLFAHAQSSDFTSNDIAKKTLGIVSSFKFDDGVGVFQINLNDTTFELVAVDNKSQLLWRSSFKGHGVACGKFSKHILAISSGGFSNSRGIINPYTAYLIDEKTGKPIVEKEIFEKKAEHQEFAQACFTQDDSKFSLIIRQAHKRSAVLSSFQDKTEDISIISLDDKLEVKIIKPKIPEGDFISMTCNSSGDFYALTCKNRNILEAWRYEYGNTEPSLPITLKCDTLDPNDFTWGSNAIAASETDRNALYFAITHKNYNDDRALLIGKYDFNKHKLQIDSEVFTGRHKRDLQKNYEPVGNDLLKPQIGDVKSSLAVRYIKEHNDKLIVTLSESFFVNNNLAAYFNGYALIINCYDSNLNKLFQQLMPVRYKADEILNSGFSLENKFFNVISNSNQTFDGFSLYGQLDMTTGKWLKLNKLTEADDYASDQHVIWFNDSFVVPYIRNPGFIKNLSKYNIRLQLNGY